MLASKAWLDHDEEEAGKQMNAASLLMDGRSGRRGRSPWRRSGTAPAVIFCVDDEAGMEFPFPLSADPSDDHGGV